MQQKWNTNFNNRPLTKFDVLSGTREGETTYIMVIVEKFLKMQRRILHHYFQIYQI